MAGLASHGASLWLGDGESPETFTRIYKVTDLNGPGFSVKFEDTTTHDNETAFLEFAAIACEAGDLALAVNYDPSDPMLAPATGLFDIMQNLERRNYQLRFPPSDTLNTRMNFAAYVGSHPFTFPAVGIIKSNISFKVDGAVTFDTFA